ncbi:MAG: hypothetical protein JSV61_02195 [Anaerolineales bacterium]|nr:MAG: hypothetical protein JSV61_02195 [Anaerolineales bacterium]
MPKISLPTASSRFNMWRPILCYGIPMFLIYGVAAFLVEVYSGSCMFVLLIYFYTLIAVLGVIREGRFGTGMMNRPIRISCDTDYGNT